jgi:tetratricopeptide (TPR) repeat protein
MNLRLLRCGFADSRAPSKCGMLFVLLLLAYAAIAACSLNAPLFPLDDTGELYFVRQAGSWSALLGHDFYHFFRPVKNLLFALYDALIRCGAGMHVVRLVPILVGAASAYAVFTLCRRLLNSHGWGLTAAAIWLLAPTLVSCTAWLSCTNILLMTGFAAASLYGHDRAGEAQAAADGPRAAGRWTLFAAVFLALALASYEGAVGTVALSFAVDFYLHPARLRQRATWQRYAVYALVLAVYLACRHALGTAGQELAGSFSNVSPLQAAASAGYFTALHAGTWLWPFGRMAVIGSYFWGQVTPALLAAYWALVLAAAALALLLRRRAPAVALGLAWFLLAFAPTSNVLGFRNGPYGDYYMALASVGAALALAAALRHLWPSGGPGAARTLAVVATTVLIGTRVAATVEAAAWSTVWNDPLKAYAANLRTFPLAFDVMIELAKCNVSRGEFRAADELAARAIGIAPDRRQAYAVRAVTAEHEGRLEDALMMAEAYRRRLNTPQDAWVLGFEADLYADRMGKPERAEPLYREAIANRPWSQDAVRVAGALAFLLAKQGNGSEAIALWEEALQYDPGSATIHHNLARAFGERGDTEKANRHRRLAEAARTAQP